MTGRVAARMAECPVRRAGSCGEIDIALGWKDAIPIGHCDKCWRLGGPYSAAGREFRERHAAAIVARVVATGIEHATAAVRLTVLGRHLTPEHAAAEKARVDALPPAPRPTVRWMGVRWYGVPKPLWPYLAARTAVASFVQTWKALRAGGCGCVKAAKDLVS